MNFVKTNEQRSRDRLALSAFAPIGVDVAVFDRSPSDLSWSELHSQRADMRRAVNTILDKAESEHRSLMPNEDAAIALATTNIGLLSNQIENRSLSGNREPMPHGQFAAYPSSTARVSDSGKRKVELRREDRVADFVGVGKEEVSTGALLRASVTGDWSGLEGFRAQQSGDSGSAGGFTLPTYLSARIIDLSRAQARVIQAGATTVPIIGVTNFATVENDPTAEWRGENQPISESETVFGSRMFTPHSLAVLVRSSLELIEDAPNVSALIESAIAAELALKLDRMCLIGDGVGKPLGLFNTQGINRLHPDAGSGPLTDYSLLSRAVQSVRDNNAEPGAFLISARTGGEIDRLVDKDGNPLRPPRSVQDRQLLTTNQIPVDMEVAGAGADNASVIFTGQWEDFYVAIRTQIRIEATQVGGGAFEKMQVLIRGYLRADAFAVRPGHFAVIEGITPPAEA